MNKSQIHYTFTHTAILRVPERNRTQQNEYPYSFTDISNRSSIHRTDLLLYLPQRMRSVKFTSRKTKILIQTHNSVCCFYVRAKYGLSHAKNSRRWDFIEQGDGEHTVFALKKEKGTGCWIKTHNDTRHDCILFTTLQTTRVIK